MTSAIPAHSVPTPQKQGQGELTVAQVLGHASVQAVAGKRNWSRAQKDAVAAFLANRKYIDQRAATAAEQAAFAPIWEKVCKLVDTDTKFAEAMDPAYVFVDFGGAAPPANYRATLDHANAAMGGAAAAVPPAGGGLPVYTVRPGAHNLIEFMNANNLNFLFINTRANADFVAGQLQALSGLSAWVIESKTGPIYR